MKKSIIYIVLGMVMLSMLFTGILPVHSQQSIVFHETLTAGEILPAFPSGDPLFDMLIPAEADFRGSKLGTCKVGQSEKLLAYLRSKPIRKIVPSGVQFALGRANEDGSQDLYALKSGTTAYGPDASEIRSVNIEKSQARGTYDLFISFDEAGTGKWARMTRENVGRDIAIVWDGEVISAPRVQEEIRFGKCRISGDLDLAEAEKIRHALE